MSIENLYVLIHSPLVGPTTWKLVAQQMQQRGLVVLVPTLVDQPASKQPYWKQHSEAVLQALHSISNIRTVTLIGHSGAGPLLPAIGRRVGNPVSAYIFVDASIPENGASRLDLMKAEDSDWAQQFHQELEHGRHYPTWTTDDLIEVIPEETLRNQTIAEIQPRALDFFTEPIPVFDDWPDSPCIYIQLSAPYQNVAARAEEDGWPVYQLKAGHFHMLVDETAVTELILKAVSTLV